MVDWCVTASCEHRALFAQIIVPPSSATNIPIGRDSKICKATAGEIGVSAWLIGFRVEKIVMKRRGRLLGGKLCFNFSIDPRVPRANERRLTALR